MPVRVAPQSRARSVELLGAVVSATTFVARLAIIAIGAATRLMEDLFSVSSGKFRYQPVARKARKIIAVIA